jgi:hypothetical protein
VIGVLDDTNAPLKGLPTLIYGQQEVCLFHKENYIVEKETKIQAQYRIELKTKI